MRFSFFKRKVSKVLDQRRRYTKTFGWLPESQDCTQIVFQPGVELLSFSCYTDGVARMAMIIIRCDPQLVDADWIPLEPPSNATEVQP